MAKRSALGLLAAAGAVLGAVAFFASRRERLLPAGAELTFDEFGFRVVAVREADALGPPGREAMPSGRFHVVTIRVANRERRVDLHLADMRPIVTDARGSNHPASPAGQAALTAAGAADPNTVVLPHGQSADLDYAFDLPPGARADVLWIDMESPLANLLEGLVHGHKRVKLP